MKKERCGDGRKLIEEELGSVIDGIQDQLDGALAV